MAQHDINEVCQSLFADIRQDLKDIREDVSTIKVDIAVIKTSAKLEKENTKAVSAWRQSIITAIIALLGGGIGAKLVGVFAAIFG